MLSLSRISINFVLIIDRIGTINSEHNELMKCISLLREMHEICEIRMNIFCCKSIGSTLQSHLNEKSSECGSISALSPLSHKFPKYSEQFIEQNPKFTINYASLNVLENLNSSQSLQKFKLRVKPKIQTTTTVITN